MKRALNYAVTSKSQLSALSSGVRQEIVDVLSQFKYASVSTLAGALGRPADALYYHLRLLERVGLVMRAGFAKQGGRPEALYRTAGAELWIDYRVARREAPKQLNAIAGAMSRLAVRDVRRALADKKIAVSGRHRALWVKRKTGWLSPSELRGINSQIGDLGSQMARPGKGARLYGLTVMFTPLKHPTRARKIVRMAVKKNSK